MGITEDADSNDDVVKSASESSPAPNSGSPGSELVPEQTTSIGVSVTEDIGSILEDTDVFHCDICADVDEIITSNTEERLAQIQVLDVFQNLTKREEALVYGYVMYSHLEIEDRKYNFKTYRQCFIGHKLVSWCLENGVAASENEGCNIGKMLWDQVW